MLKSDVEIRLAKLAQVSADNARLEAMLDRQAGEIVDLKMAERSLRARLAGAVDVDHLAGILSGPECPLLCHDDDEMYELAEYLIAKIKENRDD